MIYNISRLTSSILTCVIWKNNCIFNNDIEAKVEEFYRENPTSLYEIDPSVDVEEYSRITN